MCPSGKIVSAGNIALALALAFVDAALAKDTPAICESVAARAAQAHGIPPHLMLTLTLTETGRTRLGTIRPWPWAINYAGEGHWFDSEAEMLAYAETLIAAGKTSFDIGCFQLNYRWHGHAFASLQHMANPDRNADYAAAFLRSKYDAYGEWKAAVGAYHSETDATAAAYLLRFEAAFAAWQGVNPVGAPVAVAAPDEPASRPNSFPLLMAGNAGRGASLVPMTTSPHRLIGANE